ncbi:MAG: hypothetical protein KBS59_00590 [Clostridiales bacterium]|nr:hypothetical protein [Clostridiales bacterium]
MSTRHSDNFAISKYIRSVIAFVLCIVCVAVSCTGCFDLGDAFRDGEEAGFQDYYDTFDVVTFLADNNTKNGKQVPVAVKDSLYNSTTINDMDWKNEDAMIDRDYFMYIQIPVSRDIAISSIAMYLNADIDGPVKLTLFKGELPSVPRKYDDPASGIVNDDSTITTFTDPAADSAIAVCEVNVVNGVWKDFMFKFARNGADISEKLVVKKGESLLIRIENNTGYGKDVKTRDENNIVVPLYKKCKISFINLLISASVD